MQTVTLFATLLLAGAVDKKLEVYWIDVEGGGATLIVTPAGESVLIDAGNPGDRDPKRIHDTATRVAGLKTINHVIVTHLHVDHFGGVAELAALMPIGTLYENGIDSAPEQERNHVAVAAFRNAKVGKRVAVKPGMRIALKGVAGAAAAKLTFLAARQEFVATKGRANQAACAVARTKGPDASDNANSVATLLELGAFRMFDGGDLTWNVEGKLVCPSDRVGAVDVYQSNHHGLDVSNNPVLVHTLRPTVAVFNNGPRKGCQPESFATVTASPGIEGVYQVHKNLVEGAKNTQDDLIANQKDEGCGAYVKMSVDSGGTSYTMLLPSTNHERTYKTKKK